MIIDTKEKWIQTAQEVVPLLPDYMAEFSGQVDTLMVEAELTRLLNNQDWKMLHKRFNEIWFWLPDNSSIRHHPFFKLCDLCSEYWVFREA